MARKVLAVAVGFVIVGVSAVPVSAHEDHASCAEFGAIVAANAQSEQPWGAIVSNGAQLGFTSALTAETHIEVCQPR